MSTDVRKLFRDGRVRLLAAALMAHLMTAQSSRDLQVVDVSPQADRAAAANATQAYNQGNIIRMVGASEQDVIRLFGSRLGTFNVFQASREAAASNGAGASEPLKLQAVAGYKDAHGIVHTVQSFAQEEGPNTKIPTKWRHHLEEWVEREKGKAAQALMGGPEPPAQAWTTLYTTTIQATSDHGNFEQNTIAVYRLITKNQAEDYYLVYSIPETKPNFTNIDSNTPCDGISQCGWHTYARSFVTQSPQATALTDHGPAGTQSGESVSFSIGAQLDGVGQAGFSASWAQPDVTTTDTSTGTTASWQEAFHFSGFACNPVDGDVPPESKETWFSQQGAIFKVPGGTNSINVSVQASSQFCDYWGGFIHNGGFGFHYDGVSITANLQLGPPQLYASPTSLTVPANQSGTILVSSFIPDSPQGFAWKVTTNQAWLTVPSGGPFSTSQPVVVSVAAGTTNGPPGTVTIDSDPPFAAPSVESGPIEIQVTVGTPEAPNTAGVLLFGGANSSNTIAATPEIYDVSSKQIVPTTAPVFAPIWNSTTTLQNGDILIAGGSTQLAPGPEPPPVVALAQVFHPATRTFSATGSMNTARRNHTATLLADGKVLITGGRDSLGTALQSAEVYDPASGTFTPTGPMNIGRSDHTASLVNAPDHQAYGVMVYSGNGNRGVVADRIAEVWDEALGTFGFVEEMPVPQIGFPQPLPIANGDLAITGGYDDNFHSLEAETLADPNTQSFSTGSSLNVARFSHTLTALPALNELIAIGGQQSVGGVALGSAEVRDANGWRLVSGSQSCPSLGCLNMPRYSHTATLLPDGTVLVVGGVDQSGAIIGSPEIFNPSTNVFSFGPQSSLRAYHSATLFATSTTTLVASPNPASPDQPVTLAATVTSPVGTPAGNVDFFDGQTRLGSASLNNGQASLTTKTLAVGSHALTAVYSGDGVPAASQSSAVTEVVSKRNTTVGIASSPNPSAVGQSVTFTATVTPSSASGTITFRDGALILATPPVANGTATFRTSALAIGRHSITASYSGDTNSSPAVSPAFTQTVGQDTTTTRLTSAPNPSNSGQPVTFTATVGSNSGTSPSGTVTILDGTNVLGTPSLSGGVAALTVNTLAPGAHNVTAKYGGNSNFAGSVSPVLVQTVGGLVTPSVALTVQPSTANAGQTVTFTATVSYRGGPVPTGSITISDITTAKIYGTAPLKNGVGIATNSTIPPGSYNMVATYGGDGGIHYNGAHSNSVPLRVVGVGVGNPPPTPSITISAIKGTRSDELVDVRLTPQ